MRWGAPDIIISDQGKEFNNRLLRELTRLTGTDFRVTGPYHPQANGMVERMNQHIQHCLRKLIDRSENWVDFLEIIIHCINNSPHASTKMIPSELMFGWKPVSLQSRHVSMAVPSGPKPDQHERQKQIDELPMEEYFDLLRDHRVELIDKAVKNIKKAQKSYKYQHDRKKGAGTKIKVGDKVWKKNMKDAGRKEKLTHKVTGPYVVVEITKGGSCRLMSVDSGPKQGKVLQRAYHPSHLRMWRGPDIPENDPDDEEIVFTRPEERFRQQKKGQQSPSADDTLILGDEEATVVLELDADDEADDEDGDRVDQMVESMACDDDNTFVVPETDNTDQKKKTKKKKNNKKVSKVDDPSMTVKHSTTGKSTTVDKKVSKADDSSMTVTDSTTGKSMTVDATVSPTARILQSLADDSEPTVQAASDDTVVQSASDEIAVQPVQPAFVEIPATDSVVLNDEDLNGVSDTQLEKKMEEFSQLSMSSQFMSELDRLEDEDRQRRESIPAAVTDLASKKPRFSLSLKKKQPSAMSTPKRKDEPDSTSDNLPDIPAHPVPLRPSQTSLSPIRGSDLSSDSNPALFVADSSDDGDVQDDVKDAAFVPETQSPKAPVITSPPPTTRSSNALSAFSFKKTGCTSASKKKGVKRLGLSRKTAAKTPLKRTPRRTDVTSMAFNVNVCGSFVSEASQQKKTVCYLYC